MGVVHFPSIIADLVEEGLWCRGCEVSYEKYRHGKRDFTLARTVPPGDLEQYLARMQYRAWSKADFVRHARYCHSEAVGGDCALDLGESHVKRVGNRWFR
jgi:hypothetical protein